MNLTTIGRYQLQEQIGRGGMATVYRALDPRFKREVAVKLMTRDLLGEPTLRARFEREAQTIAALEHPAIVPVYDFGEQESRPYLVMRLMTGGTLAQRLHSGALSISETAAILQRIGSALERAHAKGVVHRDLKPSNIMFDEYGDAFLADFGIARLTESAVTLTGDSVIGTPAYMSPEQIHGDKKIDGRSDIYALGVICFEMLTGEPPYQDSTPAKVMMRHVMDPVPHIRQARPDLPEGMDTLIARTMAKEPEERYARAGELADSLSSLTADTAETPPIVPALEAAPPAAATGEAAVLDDDAETEVAPPAPDEADGAAPAGAAPLDVASAQAGESASVGAGQAARRRWIIAGIAVAGVAFLLLAVVVIGGGIFLAGRAGQTDGTEAPPQDLAAVSTRPESSGAPAEQPDEALQTEEDTRQEPAGEPQAPPEEDPRIMAEAQLSEFYERMADEDFDRALAAINRATTLVPEEPWYVHERAWLLAVMGDLEAALANADEAVAMDPENGDHYILRGALLRELTDLDRAAGDHMRAVELKPDDAYAHQELAITFEMMGDYPAALESYSEAIRHAPEDDFLYSTRAGAYAELGDLDAAVQDLETAVALNPEEPYHHDRLADLYFYQLQQPEPALDHYHQAIELEPEAAWRHSNLAQVYVELGDFDMALAEQNVAIELEPDDSWGLIDRGYIYIDHLGDLDAARADFETAIERDPENFGGYQALSYILGWHLNDFEAAIGVLDRCIEVNIASYWCYNERAWLFNELGDTEAAVENFRLFLDYLPEDDCPECQQEAADYIARHS